jgi:hypothetical protein
VNEDASEVGGRSPSRSKGEWIKGKRRTERYSGDGIEGGNPKYRWNLYSWFTRAGPKTLYLSFYY